MLVRQSSCEGHDLSNRWRVAGSERPKLVFTQGANWDGGTYGATAGEMKAS